MSNDPAKPHGPERNIVARERFGTPAARRFRLNWKDPRHGTSNGYRNLGCRCEACKAANTEDQRRLREERRARAEDIPHGTMSGYSNWGCRCEECSEVRREYTDTYKYRRRYGQ